MIEARATYLNAQQQASSMKFEELQFSSPTLQIADGALVNGEVTPTTSGPGDPAGFFVQEIIGDTNLAAHDWTVTGKVTGVRDALATSDEQVRFQIRAQNFDVTLKPGLVFNRASTSQKGSLLIFPKVEVRYDAAGTLRRDTFIHLTNNFNTGIDVVTFFIAENCAELYADTQLTANHPQVYRLSSGQSLPGEFSVNLAGLGSFPEGTVTDPVTGERVIRGSWIVFVVDNLNRQIRLNQLSGEATIIDYAEGSAHSYSPYAFQVCGTAYQNGDVVGKPGVLLLDGVNYQAPPSRLVLPFFASDSQPFGKGSGGVMASVDTELALMITDLDLRQDPDPNHPFRTKALFGLWNEDETSFSTEYCVDCWDCRALSDAGIAFTTTMLFSQHNLMEIDGVQSPVVCDKPNPLLTKSAARALLGVATKVITFNGAEVERASVSITGFGQQTATILYDKFLQPPEEIASPPTPRSTLGSAGQN